MKSKETDTKAYPLWKELLRVASTWEYGSFHSHKEIAGILGVEPQSATYNGIVQEARKALELRGRALQVRTNEGYYLVLPDEHDTASYERLKRSRAHAVRAILISTNAPVEKMSESARQKHDRYIVTLPATISMIDSTIQKAELTLEITNPIFKLKEIKPKTGDIDEVS